MTRRIWIIPLLLLLLPALTACADRTANQRSLDEANKTAVPLVETGDGPDLPGAAPAAAETAVSGANPAAPEPTATPAPAKELILCMSGPPRDLYLYGDNSPAAVGLRHAIYEAPFTSAGYEFAAQGLESLPGLAGGGAQLLPVTVNEGEQVVDVNGRVLELRKGVRVFDQTGAEVAFRGDPITMQQLAVDFTFKPLVWSDGTPVTAADSLFSFNVAADPGTAVGKARIATTYSYAPTGERSVQWRGLPGFRDQDYFSNVWLPLPAHQLDGYTAAELPARPEAARFPLSSGPFVVSAWDEPDTLHLVRNPHYYKEGLPRLDAITVRFGEGDVFLTTDAGADCDVITGESLSAANLALLQESAAATGRAVLTSPGDVFEQIIFGITPVAVVAKDRPDWFSDTRVRQAMTQCIDRGRMVDELTAGEAQPLNSYVAPDHPLAPAGLNLWAYDPAAANSLLDAAGFKDYAGDGRRQDVTTGQPMTITLGTNNESALRVQITEMAAADLAACGIPVEVYSRPAGTWYGAGPAGPVFGRQFDLAEMAWVGRVLPDCGLYLSEAIPGPESAGYNGWRGSNVGGWTNEAYDAACRAALAAMPGGEGYEAAQQEALRIFNQELPVIPLFTNVKVAAARPSVQNLRLDPSQPSLLWNVAEWDMEE
jgi:peptide/nickel transport system substrate-binding protein